MLAILETIPKKIELSEEDRFYGKTNYAYEVPVKHFFTIKDEYIKKTIQYFDFKKIDGSKLIQNPQIIVGFEPNLDQDSQIEEKERVQACHFTLVINLLTTGKKVPPLIFYNLNLEKVVKGI